MPTLGLRQAQSSCLKCGQMNTCVEDDSLGCEQLQDEPVGALERIARQARRAEPVLVGHHHQGEACALELEQRRNHAGHEANLLEAVDLLVGRLLIQRAVPIEK